MYLEECFANDGAMFWSIQMWGEAIIFICQQMLTRVWFTRIRRYWHQSFGVQKYFFNYNVEMPVMGWMFSWRSCMVTKFIYPSHSGFALVDNRQRYLNIYMGSL